MTAARKTDMALGATLAAVIVWLLQATPAFASAEPLEVQQKVDKALGVIELPDPTPVHLAAPDTVRPPLTGQPYLQQPAAAQRDFRPPPPPPARGGDDPAVPPTAP